MESNNKTKKITIRNFATFADSLTDTGTMNKKKIFFGLVKMSEASGLNKNMPNGRFTNGLTWWDQFATVMANKYFIAQQQKKSAKKNPLLNDNIYNKMINKLKVDTGVAHDVIGKGALRQEQQNNYSLNDDKVVSYRGKDFVRNFNEGGMTAAKYKNKLRPSKETPSGPEQASARQVVSNLDEKVNLCLEEDKKNPNKYDANYKASTLVTIWAGANDLVTVNKRPTKKAADLAIAAIIANIEKLLVSGYSNFVINNLPDLSLTPKFSKAEENEKSTILEITNYFNVELSNEVAKLTDKYEKSDDNKLSHLSINDVNTQFREIYDQAEKYGFKVVDSSLIGDGKQKINLNKEDKTFAGEGYMFHDDLHPSMEAHKLLCDSFYDNTSKYFDFQIPEEVHTRLEAYCEQFDEVLKENTNETQKSANQPESKTKFQPKMKKPSTNFFGFGGFSSDSTLSRHSSEKISAKYKNNNEVQIMPPTTITDLLNYIDIAEREVPADEKTIKQYQDTFIKLGWGKKLDNSEKFAVPEKALILAAFNDGNNNSNDKDKIDIRKTNFF